MEDYLKTNLVNLEKAKKIREKVRAEKGDEVAERIFRAVIADQSYLESAWKEMGDRYITDRLAMDEDTISSFRELVLE